MKTSLPVLKFAHSVHRQNSRCALILGVFLTGWFGCSNSAEAACGDWLQHAVGNASDVFAAETADREPLHRPCQGPGCRQSPVRNPPVLPVSLAIPSVDDRIVSQQAMPVIALQAAMNPLGVIAQKPCDGYVRMIDRPPRDA